MRCQGDAAGRENRAVSYWRHEENQSAHVSWENRGASTEPPGRNCIRQKFLQIQLGLTAAELEREWYRGRENEFSAVLKAPGG